MLLKYLRILIPWSPQYFLLSSGPPDKNQRGIREPFVRFPAAPVLISADRLHECGG